MSFANLVVRKWGGDKWPEKRISLGCKGDGQAVAISPRYAELSVAEQDFEEIAMRVNNYEKLVDELRNAIAVVDGEGGTEHVDKARTLLAALEAEKGGEL